MATSQKPLDGGTPPYIAFPRFEGFIGSLKGKPLPPRFDRTLVRSMSGAEQSQLAIALRFFKLIEGDDRRFTDRMRRLVEAYGKPEAWKDALTEIVGEYDDIVGELEDAATMGQLTDTFRQRGGLQGSALVKAMRFYMALARAAEVSLSPHFTAPAVPSSNGSTDRARRASAGRPRRQAQSEPGSSADGGNPGPPEGSKQLRFTVPSGDIQVWLPDNINTRELDAFAKYLKDYVALIGGGEQPTA